MPSKFFRDIAHVSRLTGKEPLEKKKGRAFAVMGVLLNPDPATQRSIASLPSGQRFASTAATLDGAP
jgi:hypothetical protein